MYSGTSVYVADSCAYSGTVYLCKFFFHINLLFDTCIICVIILKNIINYMLHYNAMPLKTLPTNSPVHLAFQPMEFYLIFNDIHVWSVLFAVFMMTFLYQDGMSNYFQGEY